jgi:hypothetical protein
MIVISGIPYNTSLTSDQKKQLPSGLLPSGEANYYDFTQDKYRPSGINSEYPFPNVVSGLYPTYPPNVNPVERSGIFNYDGLVSRFTNVSQVSGLKIESFDIFNPYIHYYRVNDIAVKIPYVSTYKISISYDPYKR